MHDLSLLRCVPVGPRPVYLADAASTVAASGRLPAPELFSPAGHFRPPAVGRSPLLCFHVVRRFCPSLMSDLIKLGAISVPPTFHVQEKTKGLFTAMARKANTASPTSLPRNPVRLPKADKSACATMKPEYVYLLGFAPAEFFHQVRITNSLLFLHVLLRN